VNACQSISWCVPFICGAPGLGGIARGAFLPRCERRDRGQVFDLLFPILFQGAPFLAASLQRGEVYTRSRFYCQVEIYLTLDERKRLTPTVKLVQCPAKGGNNESTLPGIMERLPQRGCPYCANGACCVWRKCCACGGYLRSAEERLSCAYDNLAQR